MVRLRTIRIKRDWFEKHREDCKTTFEMLRDDLFPHQPLTGWIEGHASGPFAYTIHLEYDHAA